MTQDNAQFGDHIWFETSGSGDFCYVGEQYCIAKSLVSVNTALHVGQMPMEKCCTQRGHTSCPTKRHVCPSRVHPSMFSVFGLSFLPVLL